MARPCWAGALAEIDARISAARSRCSPRDDEARLRGNWLSVARLLLGAVTEAAVACAGRSDVLKAGGEYSRAFKSLLEALRLR